MPVCALALTDREQKKQCDLVCKFFQKFSLCQGTQKQKRSYEQPFSFLEIFERSLVKALFDFVPDPE